MTHARRRELGEGDEPIETELEHTFNSLVEEGAQRLHRTWFGMLTTGFAGGWKSASGSWAMSRCCMKPEAICWPVSREGSVPRLIRLWGFTLVANLLGGWIVMGLFATGFPQWTSTLVESGKHFATSGFGPESASLAVLAGVTITLLTMRWADCCSLRHHGCCALLT